MSNSTVIVGVGEANRKPSPTRTASDLAVESTLMALASAGLERSDIDGVLTGYSLCEPHLDFSGHLAELLHLKPNFNATISRSGATGASLVALGAQILSAGGCNTLLVAWADNRASAAGLDLVDTLGTGLTEYEMPFGPLIATQYALVAQRYATLRGYTEEQRAAVAVSFREHAALNSSARYRTPITISDVLESPMISSPLHRLECTLITDFGGALILQRADYASRSGDHVAVAGYGMSCGPESLLRNVDVFDGRLDYIKVSSDTAFDMAGLHPKDIQCAQLYDCFTITVLLELEAIGFFAPHEVGNYVSNGALSRDGILPTNTNGGMLSCGNGGILHVTECVKQMLGSAGDHQLTKPPTISLVHGNGGILSTHATLILTR